MNFSELEQLMSSRGVTTLADIARALNTTPQAVSNWKARDQVPHHVVAKIKNKETIAENSQLLYSVPVKSKMLPIDQEGMISLSDILLVIAQNLKVITLTTFISIFLTFTYIHFIKKPQYASWATIILPESQVGVGGLGGLTGLASQFGVNVPTGSPTDLSSPSLFPELLRSRTFAEKILVEEFYLDKYGKKLPLAIILNDVDESDQIDKDQLIENALHILNNEILSFENDLKKSTFSVITVTVEEPVFAKQLADVVLAELDALNRYFKSRSVSEKIKFIENRIASVENDLEDSEQALKNFNERNRQIISPSLQLEQERMERDTEVQKGIYLTLKQQLELVKIEEVQETSIVQVLDYPQIPLKPLGKKLILNVMLAGILGLILGIIFSYIRELLNNSDPDERKKIRRVKHLIKKKIMDIFIDRRFSGIVSGLMLIGIPFYFGNPSQNPVYFGLFSLIDLIINTIYLLVLLFSLILFIRLSLSKKS